MCTFISVLDNFNTNFTAFLKIEKNVNQILENLHEFNNGILQIVNILRIYLAIAIPITIHR